MSTTHFPDSYYTQRDPREASVLIACEYCDSEDYRNVAAQDGYASWVCQDCQNPQVTDIGDLEPGVDY